MTEIVDTPRDFEALRALLVQRGAALPKRLAQVAAFAVEHPDEIAFGTTSQIAEKALVQPSTLVRFAQAVGYSGFSDLQTVFRSRLRDRWPDYRARIDALRDDRSGRGPLGLVDGFCSASMDSLARLRETVHERDLERAVDILTGADTIYLLAQRRAFPVASYLGYALAKLDIKVMLVDNVAALAPEQLAFACPRDALVAVSYTPYTPSTLDLARSVRTRGVPVVAITDSPLSPLAASADVWFEVVEGDHGKFRSLAATLTLVMALAVATAERRSRS